MNTYCLRPAYKSKELLIEFVKDPENEKFIKELSKALAPLNMMPSSVQDLWMNDEVLLEFQSEMGSFLLSIDNWGLAFITNNRNEQLIRRIDELLSKSPAFEKRWVDFKEYE